MVRVVLNRKAIVQLLRSAEVRADLESRARRIADRAGEGFEVDSEAGTKRARASVRTVTYEAILAEAKHRKLTHALDAARD